LAETEDTLVIIFLVAFFGLLILQGVRLFAKHIDQQNYERRQFYLYVAAELEKMDKIVAEGNQPKQPELIEAHPISQIRASMEKPWRLGAT
jgi:hypothetical protein